MLLKTYSCATKRLNYVFKRSPIISSRFFSVNAVGSGPAGFYTAQKLLKNPHININNIEKTDIASYAQHNQAAQDKIGVKVPDLHEPAYLEDLKPKVGYYALLNLQITGYDFVVLEKYQRYLHKTMKKLEFKVVDAWSTPHQEFQLEALGDRSTGVESSYKIKVYERNLQMKDALVTKLPILIDIINMTSPPGVSFNIHRHTEDDENRVYFRDSVLEQLKEELQELKDTPLIGVTV